MVKRSNNDPFMPNSWELPGGGSEFGELPEDALKREIIEECGIHIEVIKPLTTGVYYMSSNEIEVQRIEIVYLCSWTEKGQSITLSHEHDEYQWVKISQVDNLELSSFMSGLLSRCLKSLYPDY
jgi:8-oxo-dGTP pyrophosphatase MutT (NUDIX family)